MRRPILTTPVNLKIGKVIVVSSMYLKVAWATKMFSKHNTIMDQSFMTYTLTDDPGVSNTVGIRVTFCVICISWNSEASYSNLSIGYLTAVSSPYMAFTPTYPPNQDNTFFYKNKTYNLAILSHLFML